MDVSLQQTLCVFVHHSKFACIPKYVSIYLNELSGFFDHIILVTNDRPITVESETFNANITVRFVRNEGYDLGMFYKVLQTIRLEDYNMIACINDSNVLFNELKPIFDWSKRFQFDFWGIIDSHEKPWFSTHQENYHIQSHFIVFNRKAIDQLVLFFDSLDIRTIFDEKDIKLLRQKVINDWEIGLSQFLIKNGLSSGSYINSQLFSDQYLEGKVVNVGQMLYRELIESGYPLIKKKVVTKKNWKDIFQSEATWQRVIRQYGHKDWEIESMINELIQIKKESKNS